MIAKDKLQELAALPIEGVAERLGLTVRQHKSLCPFHDDRHPSLTFNTRSNRYRCFVCDAHGSTIDLVMHATKVGFVEACRWLASGSSVILENFGPVVTERKPVAFDAARYERHIREGYLGREARQFLFDERKIDPRVVRWCRLTSWRDREGIDWLQIPYYDRDWNLTGIQWRRLGEGEADGEGERAPRFRFPKGSRCHVYNLPVLKRLKEGEPLYITEGASDCWAMLSSGHKAIAIPSATLLKREELKQLFGSEEMRRLNVHIYPDQDAPGEALFLALREVFPQIVRHQLPAGCKDYGELWQRLREAAERDPNDRMGMKGGFQLLQK